MVEDVSEAMHALHEERERTAQAEARSRAKSNFVAAMSHEIRTPLHGIIGHLELLARAPLSAEPLERVLRLRQSADSLMDIITDVLDLSRIESGQWSLVPERFAPGCLLERVAVLYAPVAQAKGLQLDCVIAEDVAASVVAPMAAVERVLRNLASNALKFTASGRVQLGVSSWRADGQAWLRFDATDSGIGLSADECERLFQPFVQADASILVRFGGSGLGLALCQQLCERMGGRIQVQSTPGVGSRFLFDVPLVPAPASPVAVPLAGRCVGLVAAPGPWRRELERRLQRWGAQARLPSANDDHQPWADLPMEAPIVMFEPSPESRQQVLHSGRAWVEVCRYGPLRAQPHEGGHRVSCYASEALCRVLLGPVAGGMSNRPHTDVIG